MFKKFFAFLLLSLLLALVFEKLISLQNHSLENSAAWHSIKRLEAMPYGLMGTEEFFKERQALANEQLNLGAWFGYQDVQYREGIDGFETFNLRFELAAEAYLWVYLNCDFTQCLAIRLSSAPEFKSGIFVIQNSGELTKVAAGETLEPGAHRLGIVADSSKMHAISIDGRIVHNAKYGFDGSPLRFRSGERPVSISDIEVTGRGNQRLSLNFTTKFQFFRFFLIFGVFLVLSLIVSFVARNKNYGMLLNSVFLVLGMILFVFDKFYWSRLYLTRNVNPAHERSSNIALSIEEFRRKLFEVPSDEVRRPAEIKFNELQIIDKNGNVTGTRSIDAELANSKALKIAIAGGSQSWGGGASSLSATWGARFVKALAQKTGRDVVGVNFSICGGTLFNLLQRKDLISKFKPDLLIVNFGFNDGNTPNSIFESQMKEFLEKMTAAKLNVLFSIEATSIEHSPGEIGKASLIRRLASKNNFETINLHEYLAKPEIRNSGLMWQDLVHFTDFGHVQTASFFINTEPVKKLTSK